MKIIERWRAERAAAPTTEGYEVHETPSEEAPRGGKPAARPGPTVLKPTRTLAELTELTDVTVKTTRAGYAVAFSDRLARAAACRLAEHEVRAIVEASASAVSVALVNAIAAADVIDRAAAKDRAEAIRAVVGGRTTAVRS